MSDTLKKLREPAALAAVVFAGLVLLVAVINLLAPPSSYGNEPFSNRAYDQVTAFLDVTVAVALALSVYLANYLEPALAKARLITLIALIEAGVAALFGVVSALALFGASGVPGEAKFLRFLQGVGGGAAVAAAGLFVWLTWQQLAPAPKATVGHPGGQFGGAWPGGGPGAGQGYPQPQQAPPPGGFGWAPQQQPQSPYGQQPGVPGQGVPNQPQPQPQPFGGSDRTQFLPPVPSMPPAPAASPSTPQGQPPLPPMMQGYAPQPAPWSPAGPGNPGGQPQAPQQQSQPVRPEEPEQQPGGPFPIGDWRSE
jgi:hypothetical protein